MDHFVGFDLGGTKMLAAVANGKGEVLATEKSPTVLSGAKAIVEQIVSLVEQVQKTARVSSSNLKGLGIGVPGTVDFEKGTILGAVNLGLQDFPLRETLSNRLKIPVLLENDVNAGTFGEFCFGAAKGCSHVLGIFLGTGIGGGLIQNGQLQRGASGCAAEVGHMVIQLQGPRCSCGRFGCVEALCSRGALSREAAALAAVGKAPTILEKAGTDFRKIKSRHLAKSYQNGEGAIVKMIHRSAKIMGIALANCVYLYDPEKIVLGGGLIEKLGSSYIQKAEQSMREQLNLPVATPTQLCEGSLGDFSGVQGAAALIQKFVGSVRK